MTTRSLNLVQLLGKDHSAFLFGPRGVGKTTLAEKYLNEIKGPTLSINLLFDDIYNKYLLHPEMLRNEVSVFLQNHPQSKLTVLLDEVQRLPSLLNEVHAIIENKSHKGRINFLLTGSSARKLKREGANLLAGRAFTFSLHPLTSFELGDEWNLHRAIKLGTLPLPYLQSQDDTSAIRILKSYVGTYLKEEIQLEARIRNLQAFSRFLEMAAQMNGEPTNSSKISKQVGVSVKTIQEYYQILLDTLVAFRLDGWDYSVRKQLQKAPRFYFFDCGILNVLQGEIHEELSESSNRFGKLFESLVIVEFLRANDYYEADYQAFYYRTSTNQEVDLILKRGLKNKPIAIEIKASKMPDESDAKGLLTFREDHPKAELYIACRCDHEYLLKPDIKVLPWQEVIKKIFPKQPRTKP